MISRTLWLPREYAAKLRSLYPPLSREEEAALIVAAKAGDKSSADRVVLSNIGLMLQAVASYARTGVPPEDLFHVAVEGAMVALKKFEPERGFRFSTYAVNWCKSAMARYIFTQERRLKPKSGSEYMNLKDLCADVQASALYSLDRPLTEGGATLGELLPDSAENPEARTAESIRDQRVRKKLDRLRKSLSPVERMILDRRLMADDLGLREIGEEAAHTRGSYKGMEGKPLTRERVRQIEVQLVTRLRSVLSEFREAA